ncbi:MAG TPA: DUF6379 domain-containing protein [Anaerolineaceae bacterium]|nr:DUF6379 domain-containing protein [Anaerolineaceae bacterium]
MLEREQIQSRGFRNIVVDGVVTGFQVAFRSLYYRGVWLSQLRPATVIVDGETFSGDQLTWTISGKTYEQAEMAAVGNINWPLLEPALLTIRKPGGLAQGFHDIEIKYSFSASYMPPVMDELMTQIHGPAKRRLLMV